MFPGFWLKNGSSVKDELLDFEDRLDQSSEFEVVFCLEIEIQELASARFDALQSSNCINTPKSSAQFNWIS